MCCVAIQDEFNNPSTFRRRLRRLLRSSAYSSSYAFSVTGGDNESVFGSVYSTNSFRYDGCAELPDAMTHAVTVAANVLCGGTLQWFGGRVITLTGSVVLGRALW